MVSLIDDWRDWWRRWSTWAAGVNAALWAKITADTGLLLGFIPFLPSRMWGFAAGITFAVAFIVPVLVAQLKQKKLEEKRNAAANP